MSSQAAVQLQQEIVRLPFAVNLGIPWLDGFLDRVHVDVSGLIRVEAWTNHRSVSADELPTISLNNAPLTLLNSFRFYRKDVCDVLQDGNLQPGIEMQYLVSEYAVQSKEARPNLLSIFPAAWPEISISFVGLFAAPHYQDLFRSPNIFHRPEIYGSGPSNVQVAPEVFAMAAQLQPPILDFGCGRGALVSQLRAHGIEAYGLELGSAERRTNMPRDIAEFVSFYDGSFPSPFASGQFKSVVCSEVLEHIPQFEEAVADIGRLTQQSALFTVPDASTIPMLCRHGVVPWHLLEATHVNFFNLASLAKLLGKEFSEVHLGKMGANYINDTKSFVSLTAICHK